VGRYLTAVSGDYRGALILIAHSETVGHHTQVTHFLAICARSGFAHRYLAFKRSEVTRYGWTCSCPDCPQESRVVGTGRTMRESMEEYARASGVPVSQVEQEGELHV
jgi:hypothetical protein